MKRIANVICILSVLVVCFSIRARAEGTVCGFETIITADGRILTSTIPANTTFWFLFSLAAGHTYSVELTSSTDKYSSGSPGTATFFDPGDACSGTSTLVTKDTRGIDPMEVYNAIRVSFTATAQGSYRLKLVNSSAAAVDYTIMVTDTTLFSPRWSSYSGFVTQYGVMNKSNVSISCTLSLTDSVGGSPSPITFSVSANTVSLKVIGTSGDIVVPANHSGSAQLACLAPPGAIVADGYFINGTATVIVLTKFEPANAQH